MGLLYAGLTCSPVEPQLRLRVLAGLCGAVMLVSGNLRGEADAAEWSAAPSLSVKGLYNSNLLLFNGHNQVWGDWVTPDLKFKGSTESLWVEGGAKAEFVHYYGDQDRALTNLYFPLKASYRSDRNTFGFDGGFTRDNTLQGELQRTGLVLAFTQRSLLTAAPSWKFGITERLSWQSGYQFMNAEYENGTQLGLVNYQVQAGSTGMTYNLSERDQVQLTGEYTLVSTPSIDQTSNYYGAQGGGTHDFGRELIGTISGGIRFVNSTRGSLTDHTTVWVYNGTLSKRFERTTIQIDVSRNINPSGFGRLLKTDRVSVSLSHNLTETLTASLSGGLYFVGAVATQSSGGNFPQTKYATINPAISWKFSQWWTFDVGYTYAERAVGSLNQWNFANSTFIMLTYGGPKWTMSR
jgi:hypothetical protein